MELNKLKPIIALILLVAFVFIVTAVESKFFVNINMRQNNITNVTQIDILDNLTIANRNIYLIMDDHDTDTNTQNNTFFNISIADFEKAFNVFNITIAMYNNLLSVNPFDFYNATNYRMTLPWINLTSYPDACPGSSAITQLDDSVTCSDLWVDEAGDTMTGSLNSTGYFNASRIEANDYRFGNNTRIIDLGGFANTQNNTYRGCNAIACDLTDDTIYWTQFSSIPRAGNFNTSLEMFTVIDNSTFLKSYTESDPVWGGYKSNVAFENESNTFTAGQSFTGENITAIECIIFDSGGKICTGT